MGYTPDKISNADLKKLILDAVSESLDKHPDIGENSSVAYYGCIVKWDMNISLISRAEVNTKASGKKLIGDPANFPLDQKVETTKVSGEAKKGRQKVHGPDETSS